MAFLQSIDAEGLASRAGLAVTLTMGGWPSSSSGFHSARRAFLKRAARDGWVVQHWLVESTALGRPHLHLALYGGRVTTAARWSLAVQWLLICEAHGWEASPRAQTVEPITGLLGWLQYVAKHGSRGVSHYQRATPIQGWEKTGRLWGHTANWPIPEPLEYELTEAEFHRFRRIALAVIRGRLRASGATSTTVRRVGSQVRDRDPSVSRRAGIGYWLDRDAADAIVSLSIGREPAIRYHDWE